MAHISKESDGEPSWLSRKGFHKAEAPLAQLWNTASPAFLAQSPNIYIYLKCTAVCVCPQSLSCVWLFFDPMEGSLPSSSDHGIFQARILERVAISSSRGSSQSRDRTWVSCVSCIGRWIIYHWANWEAHNGVLFNLKKKETFSFAITEMT